MRTFIRTQAELEAFCLDVCEDKEVTHVSADVETEYIQEDNPEKSHPWQLDLHGIGVCAGKDKQAYIVHDPSLDYSVLDVLFHTFPVVFHNATFDIGVLEAHKALSAVDEAKVHDTMIMSYMLDENKESHKLKDLAVRDLKVPADKVVRLKDVGEKPTLEKMPQTNLFDDVKDEKVKLAESVEQWEKTMGEYCMDDCDYTHRLFSKYKKEMEEQPTVGKVYWELEIPFMKVLYSMEKNGIAIDEAYLGELSEKVEQRLIDIGAEIYKEAGREFTIGSPKQLQEVFAEKKIQIPEEFKTKTGAASTGVQALEHLAEQGVTLAANVLKYRELVKLQNTYIQALPKKATKGIVHCSWWQIGAKTGRISCRSPNLQNIPRRDDDMNIRKAFVPKPGNVFVIADYSQIELRIMAYCSQDPTLIQTYQDGGDVHKATAEKLGCDRVTAKQVNFGLNYGRTAMGMSKGLGMTVEEAEKFIEKYFQEFPKVKEFMDRAKQTVQNHKYVETVIGRRRRFSEYNRMPVEVVGKPGLSYEKMDKWDRKTINRQRLILNGRIERQACNAIIQGSAADIIKIAMRNMHDKLKPFGAYLLVQIHDEVLVECPKDKADEVVVVVKECMESAVTLKGVPLLSEPKIATSWEK